MSLWQNLPSSALKLWSRWKSFSDPKRRVICWCYWPATSGNERFIDSLLKCALVHPPLSPCHLNIIEFCFYNKIWSIPLPGIVPYCNKTNQQTWQMLSLHFSLSFISLYLSLFLVPTRLSIYTGQSVWVHAVNKWLLADDTLALVMSPYLLLTSPTSQL